MKQGREEGKDMSITGSSFPTNMIGNSYDRAKAGSSTPAMNSSGNVYQDLIDQLTGEQQSANTANEHRLNQMTAIYDEIIARYQPGGSFGQGFEQQLGQQKVRDVGGKIQQMISSGTFGTSTAAGTGDVWESGVGNPARLQLSDLQMERLSSAQIGKDGMLERVEDTGPDYGAIAELAFKYGQGQGGTMSSGGGDGGGQSTSYIGKADSSKYDARFAASGAGKGMSAESRTRNRETLARMDAGMRSKNTANFKQGLLALGFEDDPEEALKKKKDKGKQTIAGMWATQSKK